MRLLLASKSEARRAMLAGAGVPFETVDAALDEEAAKAGLWSAGFEAADMAEELAQLKALSVHAGETDLVLGADQVLERDDGSILSKPASREEAYDQLVSLRSTAHRLHSSAVIALRGEAIWWGAETATLTMRAFSDAYLRAYLDQEWEQVRWNVGGYRIEGPGVQLFERIEGSHFAILGLPLLPLLSYLRECGLLTS
jgi:septum formation protein